MDVVKYRNLFEYKNIVSLNLTPSGCYVNPTSIDSWSCVQFIHSGFYKGAVFKYSIDLKDDPKVTFITDMFHPLIDSNGVFNYSLQFQSWTHQNYLIHLLNYIKNCFKEAVLMTLVDSCISNKLAWELFVTDRLHFSTLANQCAILSNSDVVYDDVDFGIQFSRLEDDQYETIKDAVFIKS